MIRICFLFSLFFLLSGCVYGPPTEKKHPLNYLNGENYATSEQGRPDILLVPIVKSNQRLTHIQGDLQVDPSVSLVGVISNLEIGLFDKRAREVQRTRSDPTGHFVFNGIIENGEYSIRPLTSRYVGSQTIRVKDYEMKGVIVFVTPNDP